MAAAATASVLAFLIPAVPPASAAATGLPAMTPLPTRSATKAPAHSATAMASRLVSIRASQVGPPADSHRPQATGLYAVSCTAPGSCAAGGNYEDTSGSVQPMVAARAGGRWRHGSRLILPGNAARQPYAQVNDVACVKRGFCAAVGTYTYNTGRVGAFIAMQSRGHWARAVIPRLPPDAATPATARLMAVACRPDGFCEAVGSYLDTAGRAASMALATPPGGAWGRATQIAAPPVSRAAGTDAVMTAIACTAPGSCVAVGHYALGPGASRGMGAVQIHGRWRRAAGIPAPPGAIPGNFTAFTSVSCTRHGSCLAVGAYALAATRDRAMSVTESHGTFGTATTVTAVPAGSATLPSTALSGVSCPPVGPCLAVGVARNATGRYVAMYATVSRGRWRAALLPGPADAGTGRSQQSSLFSVSCPRARRCTAVGYYTDAVGGYNAAADTTR